MHPMLRRWWHRIKALWKGLVASVLLPLALDALHEWLRDWIAGQSGWFVPILRTIVNHPWFPWGLLPIGVLVLIVKAYADAQTLTSGSQSSFAPRTSLVETEAYATPNEAGEIIMPRVEIEAGPYDQWVGDMRAANRDGQLVGVIANFGRAAERFDSEEKFIFPQVLPRYLDV